MTDTTHDLVFQNAGAGRLAAGIATFGQVFQRGEVPAGAAITAQAGSTSLAVQMDVKTRYEDGSVKMAVLSVARPALAAGESLHLVLSGTQSGPPPAALDLAQGLKGHSFTVDIAIHGGAQQTVEVLAALRAALKDGSASFWQQGPLASQARVEIDLPGSQRMVFDVTAFRGGGFAVEAQFNNDQAMQAQGGRASTDITVRMDGKVVARETVTQSQYQNWHESFASNARDGGQGSGSPAAGWLNIQHDIAHLQATGAVANYDLGLAVDPKLLAGYAQAMQAPGWDAPMATNGVATYMPGTGGRADIGFTTLPNTVWLMTQDARAAAYALGQAETASAVPWHFWDAANGRWLDTDAYPNLWLDGRGGNGRPGDAGSKGLTQQLDSLSGWSTDAAHQPDLSYVPYLMTGARWMLDNLQAQAAWNILGQWPDVRGGNADNVVDSNQVRGAAWSLRQIDEAALVSPDGSAEKAFFQEASAANYAWLVSMIPEWTAKQGEAHGWVPGAYGTAGALPPWQQDYFASTVIAAARQGNADAKTFLEWQSNFLVGRFMAEDEGFETRDGAAYLIAIGDATTGRIYTSWEEIGAQTAARGWSNGDNSWKHSEGDYAQLALATLAGIHEVTGSAAAKAAYEALIAEKAPFSTPDDFGRNPTYAIEAPGGGSPATPPIVVPPIVVPPVEPPAAPAMVPLAIVLGAESWRGNPIAVVKVDGVELFRGAVSALHSAGGQRYELGEVAAGRDHVIKVAFLNDAYGGSPDADRNLYVKSILVDGVATGRSEMLETTREATFVLKAEELVSAPEPPQDVLAIRISGDAWKGHARYVITLDEVQQGGIRLAGAERAKGESEVITLTGDFADAPHKLAITFLNDAYGGVKGKDRNLHVEAISLNGTDLDQSASLIRNGSVTFDIVGTPAQGVVETIGSGPDLLRLALSQDRWGEDAQFLLFLDGVQLGGPRSVGASHAAGEVEIYALRGDFDAGDHVLGVRFINDAWGGTGATDRNLHIDYLSMNGETLHDGAALLMNGDVFLQF
ncbi:carbohydrate-binding domain-containing protein [Falsiroseomonas sp.]|uniref:carbohydrate-binding domain-containing protein n=1 Tax=Falsiroseomonas sp. TaxID=2870721 RepID=UPI003F715D09